MLLIILGTSFLCYTIIKIMLLPVIVTLTGHPGAVLNVSVLLERSTATEDMTI